MSADLVTCSKIIAIHSLQTKAPLNNYTYHRGLVNAVSINHNNKVIASCGQDGKLFLVNAEKPENKLIEHNFSPNVKEKPSSLNTCAFSPNSKYIAVGSVDSVIRVWDIRGDNTVKKQPNITQIKSHMCGITSLAWLKQFKTEQYGTEILASSSSSGQIFIHSNKTGVFSEILAFKMQEGINCIKVSEGSDYCRLAACTNGGSLALWDLLSGKDKPFWQTSVPNQNKVSLTSLSISSYSPVLLVTSSMNESLVFFDIHEKKSVKTIAADEPLSCVGLHGNGHTLVAGGMYGSCFVYDLRNPSKPQNKLAGHQTTIKHLQFFRARQTTTTIIDNKATKTNSMVSNNTQALLQQKPSSTLNIIAAESKTKEAAKIPEPKVNNLVNPSVPSLQGIAPLPPAPIPIKKELVAQDKKLQTKLSSTGQEVIRNNSILKPEFLNRFNEPTSQLYRNRYPYPETNGTSGSRQSQGRELREVKEKVWQIQTSLKQMKNEMYQMQQRLNMSIIRQFQIHHNQMKFLLQSMLSREREKDEYIKKLEAENSRLKHSTF